MVSDPFSCRMNVPCAVEWTEDVVYHRRLRHTPCPESHFQGINVHHVFQDVRDVVPSDTVVDGSVRVVFAELERLGVLALRNVRTLEA